EARRLRPRDRLARDHGLHRRARLPLACARRANRVPAREGLLGAAVVAARGRVGDAERARPTALSERRRQRPRARLPPLTPGGARPGRERPTAGQRKRETSRSTDTATVER